MEPRNLTALSGVALLTREALAFLTRSGVALLTRFALGALFIAAGYAVELLGERLRATASPLPDIGARAALTRGPTAELQVLGAEGGATAALHAHNFLDGGATDIQV